MTESQTEIKVEERELQPEAMDELEPTANTSTMPDVIPCPICREPIIQEAKKCKHCGDYLNQGWSGFKGKTLWDLLGLIVIPLTLAIVGFFLANMQDSRQLEIEAERISAQSTIESNRAMSNILQSYLDDMSNIVLEKDLEDEKVQSAIRARTVSTISELDASRNATIVEFLNATHLLNEYHILQGANLSEANLRRTNLRGADLREANLFGADLLEANLHGANLRDAYLFGANLSWADMRKADLFGANLSYANLQEADLFGANLQEADLGGADLTRIRYNKSTRWPEGFDPIAAGAINVDE